MRKYKIKILKLLQSHTEVLSVIVNFTELRDAQTAGKIISGIVYEGVSRREEHLNQAE